MEITEKLKSKFCKDMNIPIKIFVEPYFTSRMDLFNSSYDTKSKYSLFLEVLSNFETEQEFYQYYNKLKDDIINHLSKKEGLNKFKGTNDNGYIIANEFSVMNLGFPSKDIYKPSNVGKYIMSIDMVKANYSCLKHYDSSIVDNTSNYEEFIGQFTEYEYFKKSKYIRQVVFGNHNPKRQGQYQKYLMDKLLTDLLEIVPKENILMFSNDEIVIDLSFECSTWFYEDIMKIIENQDVELKYNFYKLFYDKEFGIYSCVNFDYIKWDDLDIGKISYKCANPIYLPLLIKKELGLEVEEEDRVFIYDGWLCKLLEAQIEEDGYEIGDF